MGYFSRLDLDIKEKDVDRSYPSEEMLLEIRLGDLLMRKEEMEELGACYGSSLIPIEDIDTILPEHIITVRDINIAIERTYFKLYGEYEIPDVICTENKEDSMCEGQIGFVINNDGELIFDAA